MPALSGRREETEGEPSGRRQMDRTESGYRRIEQRRNRTIAFDQSNPDIDNFSLAYSLKQANAFRIGIPVLHFGRSLLKN
jgi:hypothetical protein